MKNVAIIILLAVIACSCGPARKLRKAQQLINKAKQEGAIVTHDTIYQEKRVEVKGETVTNTVFSRKDTTIFKTIERVKIKEVFRNDTVFQYIQCPDSVVKVKSAAQVNEIIQCPPQSNIWKIVAGTLLLVFVLYVWLKR